MPPPGADAFTNLKAARAAGESAAGIARKTRRADNNRACKAQQSTEFPKKTSIAIIYDVQDPFLFLHRRSQRRANMPGCLLRQLVPTSFVGGGSDAKDAKALLSPIVLEMFQKKEAGPWGPACLSTVV
jgi:hypothetical protein